MNNIPTHNRALKSEHHAVAEKMVFNIEHQALSIGWTLSQLEDLSRILSTFTPAKIGAITLLSIEIMSLHNDGSHRGSTRFYNIAVDQPWLKVSTS